MTTDTISEPNAVLCICQSCKSLSWYPVSKAWLQPCGLFLFVVCTHCLCLIVLAPSLLSLLRIPLSELHSLPVGASTQFLSQMYLFQLWVETREHFLLPLQINQCKSCSFFPAVSFGCRFLCIADGVQVPGINANVPLFTCLPSLTSQIDLHCFM